MKTQLYLAVIVATLAAIIQPASAEACSCTGPVSSATAFRAVDLVFVATAVRVDEPKPWSRVNAEGSISGGTGTEPQATTFQVTHTYRGLSREQVLIVGDGANCGIPFKLGETWLVYAHLHDGHVTTDKCTRTRLRADAEASRDLAYLDGLERGRQQGVAYGEVLRRVVARDGRPALQALFEPLQVIAAGDAGRFQVTTDKWGPYQLVLPPGDFEVWVERAGRAVAPRQMVHIDDRVERRLLLTVEYEN